MSKAMVRRMCFKAEVGSMNFSGVAFYNLPLLPTSGAGTISISGSPGFGTLLLPCTFYGFQGGEVGVRLITGRLSHYGLSRCLKGMPW